MLKSIKQKLQKVKWRQKLKRASLVLLLLTLLLFTVRELGIAYYKFPCELIENPPPAKIVLDRQGNIIWAETNKDRNWQIPVPLSEVSPWMIKATVSAEDSRFFSHSGVDTLAVFRAAVQSASSGRIRSGASTLTMQLVKMAHLKGRSVTYKFRQVCEALSLERQRSKEWILERYLNYAPYGGNIIGVEAAARFYFRKSAKDLSLKEASLLAGLPQAPSNLRPDRFPEAALKRQRYVLKRMLAEGIIEQIPEESLYERSADRPGDCRLGLAQNEDHIANMFGTYGEISTTIDSALQGSLRRLTESHLKSLSGVDSAALVLIDNKSAELRALISAGSEKVNTALSPRSSGSTLKPFIYLALMERGAATALTKLNDEKLTLKDYDVRNFSGRFRGNVTLKKALTSSLNVPAVRALQKLGVSNFLTDLKSLGFTSVNRSPEEYGLSLALGGAEVSLLQLCNAYSCLAGKGEYRPVQLLTNSEKGQKLYDAGTVESLSAILSSESLGPGTTGRVSWKTGTSNGFRDAWCIAYNDEVTLGVWLGNENGEADKNLIGSLVAAPLVYKALNEIYPHGLPLRSPAQNLVQGTVCSVSGLRPASLCKNRELTDLSDSVTIGNCDQCIKNAGQSKDDLQILSPKSGNYKCIMNARLELKANAGARWFINGSFAGEGNMWYDFPKGEFRISCVGEKGVKLSIIKVE